MLLGNRHSGSKESSKLQCVLSRVCSVPITLVTCVRLFSSCDSHLKYGVC